MKNAQHETVNLNNLLTDNQFLLIEIMPLSQPYKDIIQQLLTSPLLQQQLFFDAYFFYRNLMSMTKLNRNVKERVSDKSIGYKEHLFHSEDISILLISQSYKL